MDTPSYVSLASQPSTPELDTVPFNHLVKEWTEDKPRKRYQGFSHIPREVAVIIVNSLDDPVDRISIALTSKPLWVFLRTVLDLDQFKLQGILPTRFSPLPDISGQWRYFNSPRWRLLERLEDKFWKCCAGCLYLQPVREFSQAELYKKAVDTYCKVPGLVQLCPHIILTYKKCMTLQAALHMAKGGSKGQQKQEVGGGGDASQGRLTATTDFTHHCVLESDETRVTCTISPKLSHTRNHLVFRNRYVVSDFSKDNMTAWMSQFANDVLLPCPHRNVSTHILDMLRMHRPWSKSMVPKECDRKAQNVWCKFCWTYYYDFESSERSPLDTRIVSFSTQRHVGNGIGSLEEMNDSDRVKNVQAWVHKTDHSNIISVVGGADQSQGGYRFARKKQWNFVGSLPTDTWKK